MILVKHNIFKHPRWGIIYGISMKTKKKKKCDKPGIAIAVVVGVVFGEGMTYIGQPQHLTTFGAAAGATAVTRIIQWECECYGEQNNTNNNNMEADLAGFSFTPVNEMGHF